MTLLYYTIEYCELIRIIRHEHWWNIQDKTSKSMTDWVMEHNPNIARKHTDRTEKREHEKISLHHEIQPAQSTQQQVVVTAAMDILFRGL